MSTIIITAAAALVVGGVAGYAIFRYVLTEIYKKKMAEAEKDADVIKEKKLLEVKEKFLNKKNELDKEVQLRNQKMQAVENRLKQRELTLNQRQEEIGRSKQDVEREQQRLENEKSLLEVKRQDLDKMQDQERAKLEGALGAVG
jgi:ribonuclease Y